MSNKDIGKEIKSEIKLNRQSGGGSATAAGMNFQNRVAAWVSAYMLMKKSIFGLYTRIK